MTVPPYHAQTNPVEQANRTLKQIIIAYLDSDHRLWDEHLHEFRYAINTAEQASTKTSPAFLNFGRELRPPNTIEREKTLTFRSRKCPSSNEKIAYLDYMPYATLYQNFNSRERERERERGREKAMAVIVRTPVVYVRLRMAGGLKMSEVREVHEKTIALSPLSLRTSSFRTRVPTRVRCLGLANQGERLRDINRNSDSASTRHLSFASAKRQVNGPYIYLPILYS